MRRRPTAEVVAVVLAFGINIALLTLTAGVLWSLVANTPDPVARFEPSRVVAITTVLTGWGGGILGILGGYVGYTFGVGVTRKDDDA